MTTRSKMLSPTSPEMLSLDTSIIGLLRGVRVELTCASVGDTLSLARPRARLAWIASLLPPECDDPRRVLDTIAQVGAEIGLGLHRSSRDTIRLKAAVQAVTSVMDHLANPRSSEARRSMEEAERTLTAVSNCVHAATAFDSTCAVELAERPDSMRSGFAIPQAPPGNTRQQ